jgi:hypothetical protein
VYFLINENVAVPSLLECRVMNTWPESTEHDMSMFSSSKSRLFAFLLAFFGGVLGLHRFYVGKFWTGLLQLFTAGGLGVWCFIDCILILIGVFTDDKGRPLTNW